MVTVCTVVRDRSGAGVPDGLVKHVYTIEDGPIRRMEIQPVRRLPHIAQGGRALKRSLDGDGTPTAPAARASETTAPISAPLALTGTSVAGRDAIQAPASVIEFAWTK